MPSKDYFEHLRTIHFALIAICAAGIILAMASASTAVSSARAQLDGVYSLVADWDPSFLQERGAVNADPRVLPDALGVPKITNTAQKLALVAKFKTQQPASFVTTEGAEKRGWHTDCSIDTPRAEGAVGPLNPRRVGDVIPAPKNIREFRDIWDTLYVGTTLNEIEWTEAHLLGPRIKEKALLQKLNSIRRKRTRMRS